MLLLLALLILVEGVVIASAGDVVGSDGIFVIVGVDEFLLAWLCIYF